MPKFRVTINYSINMTEIHEVEFDPSDPHEVEALEQFHEECPGEFCGEDTLKEKIEGDCLSGSWNTNVEEINALDQIVDALVEADKVD